MRPASLIALMALAAALAVARQAAFAQSVAYAVPGTTNVRAGPGTQYPILARVRGGTELIVYGCLSDSAWCDIQVYDTRGWMSSRRLEFAYAGSRVPVPDYYGYFDAPIISFNFGTWDRHYDDRPFYRRWRRHRQPDYQHPGDVTNDPGIEHPGGGTNVYGEPPQGGYEQPPVTGVYDQPGGGYEQPSDGSAGGPGPDEPPQVCPPDVVC